MSGRGVSSTSFCGGGIGITGCEDPRALLGNGGGGGGSSSSYYFSTSGSSNSSSVENISTSSSIENGDQLTITFIAPHKLPSSRCLSPLLEDIFALEEEINEICLSSTFTAGKNKTKSSFDEGDIGGLGRPVSASSSHSSSSPSSSSALWYNNDFKNGISSSFLKTVRNDDECGSSSSTYSQVIQHLSGDGILLRSLEKAAPFPYLHLSTGSLCVTPTSFQEENRDIKQGVYKEIKRVVPPDSWIKLESDTQSKSTWLFLGFKTLDKNNEVLEQSWKEWTGVRHLYLELRTDINIRRISFFRRSDPPPNCLETFTYIAFIEIGLVSPGRTHRWLLDFVERARLERLQRTMIVYEEIELWETDSGIIPQA